MSQPEFLQQPPKEIPVIEVIPNVPFKPFEGLTSFYPLQQAVNDKQIPSDEEQDLHLRRKYRYKGVEGYIDIVDEEFSRQFYNHENPLGPANFVLEPVGDGADMLEYTQVPIIIRLSAFLQKPKDVIPFFKSAVAVGMQENGYFLIWHNDEVSENLFTDLNEGKEVILAERNLVKTQDYEKLTEEVGYVEKLFPITHAWLPHDLEALSKIQLVFLDTGNDGNSETDDNPVPGRSRDLVGV